VTTQSLLADARQRGARLTVTSAGRLRARGPLTADLKAALAARKHEIVRLLSTGDPLLDRVCDVSTAIPSSSSVVPFDTPAARAARARVGPRDLLDGEHVLDRHAPTQAGSGLSAVPGMIRRYDSAPIHCTATVLRRGSTRPLEAAR
jgi:hypothetical protein